MHVRCVLLQQVAAQDRLDLGIDERVELDLHDLRGVTGAGTLRVPMLVLLRFCSGDASANDSARLGTESQHEDAVTGTDCAAARAPFDGNTFAAAYLRGVLVK